MMTALIEVLPKEIIRPPSGPHSLHGLETLGDARQVIVVGDEACRDALAAGTGRTVLSWAGGTQGVKHTDWSPLARRNVVIWPDADGPGLATANEIALILVGLGCTVRRDGCYARRSAQGLGRGGCDPRWLGRGAT